MVDFWVRPLHRWILDPVVWCLLDLSAMIMADSMRGKFNATNRMVRYIRLAAALSDRDRTDFPLDVDKWRKFNDRLQSRDIVQ